MKYSDLSEQERAALSQDEIERFIKIELMEEGIKEIEKPEPFGLQEPKLAKKKFYGVSGDLFTTPGNAEKYIQLRPSIKDYDYDVGSAFSYAEPRDALNIEVVELFDKSEVRERADELHTYSREKARWDARMSKYELYLYQRNKIANKITEDWLACMTRAEEDAEVRRAFTEYLDLANGDSEVAMKFLEKTYGSDKVSRAFKNRDETEEEGGEEAAVPATA